MGSNFRSGEHEVHALVLSALHVVQLKLHGRHMPSPLSAIMSAGHEVSQILAMESNFKGDTHESQ